MDNRRNIERFGEKLHALRSRQSMTLQELANRLGLTAHSYISELEAGKKVPTAEFVLNVARLFDVTTDELLKDELEITTNE
jgi:transcriptional regulator with XRE-family HTH domain